MKKAGTGETGFGTEGEIRGSGLGTGTGESGTGSRGSGEEANPGSRIAKPESPRSHSDVSQLPAELKALVEQMLIEGAACEDVVEAVNERGGEQVTQQAVENYFRGNLELQQQRIQRLKQNGLVLKTALGDPDSAMHDLAEALLLTGVMEATRAKDIDRALGVKLRLQNENLGLKKQILMMRERDERQKRSYLSLRMKTERARHDKISAELNQLKDALRVLKKGDKLDAESLRKIREIYGIVSEPIIPPEVDRDQGAESGGSGVGD